MPRKGPHALGRWRPVGRYRGAPHCSARSSSRNEYQLDECLPGCCGPQAIASNARPGSALRRWRARTMRQTRYCLPTGRSFIKAGLPDILLSANRLKNAKGVAIVHAILLVKQLGCPSVGAENGQCILCSQSSCIEKLSPCRTLFRSGRYTRRESERSCCGLEAAITGAWCHSGEVSSTDDIYLH